MRPDFVRGPLLALFAVPAAAQAHGAAKLPGPLPVDAAAGIHQHVARVPVDLSPDGKWLAHTEDMEETIALNEAGLSVTGKSLADGENRMQASLVDVGSGRIVRLGGARDSSWAPVWSPDARRVAYYSDESGQASLWMWERSTGKARQFPGVIVWPGYGFETVRWMSDGQRLLCKILPAGMTIAEANAALASAQRVAEEPAGEAKGPPVRVLTSGRPRARTAAAQTEPRRGVSPVDADLALLDWRTGSIVRITERAQPRWYAISPNERYVAYTSLDGYEPHTAQPNFTLTLYDIERGTQRTLAEGLRLAYGMEWSWSPDSRLLAYVTGGSQPQAKRDLGEISVVSVDDGTLKKLAGQGAPFNYFDGEGEHPPLWDESGRTVYAIGKDDNLWGIDVPSGKERKVGDIPGYRIVGIVSRPERGTAWSGDGGRSIWVVVRQREGHQGGIFQLDVARGAYRAVLRDERSYSTAFNLDAADATGAIAYVTKDQQRLKDVWLLDTKSGRTRQVTHINPQLERYALGHARVISWYGVDGQPLRGTLLLPPAARGDRRFPLVVWVYGGAKGSEQVNRFGLVFDGEPAFDMHLLATRGYAVLFPDAPLRQGRQMEDLMYTVMPGVNAAIELGYADPERMAVMGQSYGAYCVMALITQTNRFKAAVISAAVTHPDLLADYLKRNDVSISFYEGGQGNLGGPPWKYPGRYLGNSPIFTFDRIETPLLIVQGTRDGLMSTNAIFAALERLGKVAEYRIYENEGHVITRKPNVIDFWNRRFEFLAQHLDLTLDAQGAIEFGGERGGSSP